MRAGGTGERGWGRVLAEPSTPDVSTVIVDLGTDWEPRDARRPARSVRGRVIAAGLVLVAVLAWALGGSASPHPALVRVAAVEASITDSVLLIGDHLFVLGRNASRLDAYALPGGRHLWRLGFGDQIDGLQVDAPSGVLLVGTFDAGQRTGRVTALDLSTGRSLWEQADANVANLDIATGVLLARVDWAAPGQVRLVDVRTGAVRWSRPFGPLAGLTMSGPDRVVLRAPSGEAQILDFVSGRVLASGQLGEPVVDASRAVDDPNSVTLLYPAGGRLYLVYPGDVSTSVAAYDAATFRPIWRNAVGGRLFGVSGCGPVLCANGDGGVTGLDLATGAVRWRDDEWLAAYADGDGLRATAYGPTGGGSMAVLDPATGKVRLDFRQWVAPQRADAPGWAPLATRAEIGRLGAWVGVLDIGHGRVSPVAWLPEVVTLQCQFSAADAGQGYLACTTHTGGVDVWRYRPG